MIHGRNLIVALDGVAVAAAKTCSLDIDQSFLEACSPVSGRTHTKIPTTYDWGVSVDGLVANNSSPTVNLEDKLIAGTKCLLTFTDGSGNRRAGFVYVKSCKESGPVGGLATYSASFESTGPLYKYNTYGSAEFIPGREGGFSVNPISFNNDRHYRIWVASFTTVVKGRLIVRYFGDDTIVTDILYNIAKNALSNNDYLILEQAAIASSDDEEIQVEVPAGSYTILFNAYYTDVANPQVIFIEEM